MIFIIIPVYNRKELTYNCLKSLQNQTFKNFKIIIIDDGSTDGTENMIQQSFPDTIVLKGNGNLWWTGATNLGVKYVLENHSDYNNNFILTLNNDLVVENNYLEEMSKLANQFPKSLIGSVSININNRDILIFCGLQWKKIIAKVIPIATKKFQNSTAKLKLYNKIIYSDLLPGRGTLIPLSVFNNIGLFDEKNFPQYVADEDFSIRAKKVGYNLILHPSVFVLSHAEETGTDFKNVKINYHYLKHVFSSIKSSLNIKVRYKFAMKHTKLGILYFLIDMCRIFIFLFRNFINQTFYKR